MQTLKILNVSYFWKISAKLPYFSRMGAVITLTYETQIVHHTRILALIALSNLSKIINLFNLVCSKNPRGSFGGLYLTVNRKKMSKCALT